jgi:WD40 repeat protein
VATLSTFVLAADAPKAVSFKNDVAPILAKHCLACHGQADPKGEYQLYTFAAMLKPGESDEPPITPSKIKQSYLFTLVSSTEEGERMPKDADPLARREIETIRRWIAEGAKFDGPDKQAELTTYLPRRVHPAAPQRYRTPVPVAALAFSPDGDTLAVGGYREITVWNPTEGKLVRRIGKVDQRVYSLDYQPSGDLLAAATGTPGESGEAAFYDPAKGKLVRVLATSADVMLGIAFSPDGKQLVSAGADRAIRVFDVASGKRQKLIEDHADWVQGIAWNRQGTRLVSAGRDKVAKVFDVKTGEALVTFVGHEEPVYTVAFSTDGKLVYSGGGDKKVRAWKESDAKEDSAIKFSGDVLKLVVWDKRIFATGTDKIVHELNTADLKKEVRSFKGHNDYVFSLAVDAKHKRLASGGYDGQVFIWNLDNGELITSFCASPGYEAAESTAKK